MYTHKRSDTKKIKFKGRGRRTKSKANQLIHVKVMIEKENQNITTM